MVESEPVSDLVSRGASQVEVSHGTTRKGRVENNDSVVLGVGRVVGRESSVTEETLPITAGETDGVEVERAGISRPECVLHGGLLGGVWSGVVEPPRVRCPGDVLQLEAETRSGIILIQDIDLVLDLGISGGSSESVKWDKKNRQSDLRNITSRDVPISIDNVEVHRDRVCPGSGDPDVGLVLGEKSVKSILSLADNFRRGFTSTLADGGPRLNVV